MITLPKAALFWHTLIHAEPASLVLRLGLELRRRCQQALPWTRPGKGQPLEARPALPSPLFPPRTELGASGETGPEARFLNQVWPLPHPMAWRPSVPQLAVMNLHYMEYLEGLDPAEGQRLVQDWICANPAYGAGFWRDSWNSYALSIRCLVWMQETARGRLRADPVVLDSLCEQVRFLAANLEIDIRGNHLIKNIKTLLWAGAFFQGGEAASWTALGIRLLATELPIQVLTDGVHFERSPAYHVQVFADLLECYHVLPEHPIRAALGEALDLMAQATADLTHPDGLISLFSDGGQHMAYPPASCLEAHERLRSLATRPRPCFALAEGGYFGLRDGEDYLLVDCGPIAPDALPAHGHGDALAFEWSLGGRRLIIDKGVFEYKEGALRAQSRATSSHNTVTLDGLDQCQFWKSFRIGRRARVTLKGYQAREDGFSLEGTHTGYAHLPGRPTHVRSFSAEPGRIVIEDRILGGSGQRAEARLLLDPNVQTELLGEKVCLLSLGREQVLLEGSHPLRLLPAVCFPDFGAQVPTRQVLLAYGPAPCQGGFSLLWKPVHPAVTHGLENRSQREENQAGRDIPGSNIHSKVQKLSNSKRLA